MNSAKLNDWMQVFGIFALVASLIFVGLQIRQDREIATIEAMSARSDAISNLAEMIGSNKAVWVSGLNDDELSEEDKATFHAMNEAVESYFASWWFRVGKIGGSGAVSAKSVIDDYAYAIYTHGGLRRAWNNQLEYWRARDSASGAPAIGVNFRDQVDARLAQFDKDAPARPDDKRYVFW
jgi:hypothetical protein